MIFVRRLALAILAGGLCSAGLAAPCRADPVALSFVDSSMKLDSRAPEVSGFMVLKADNLDADGKYEVENLADAGVPTPPAAVAFKASPLDQNGTSRRWLLTATFTGLPRNEKQQRYLSFKFGGKPVTLEYSVENTPSGTFAWTVRPPPKELNLQAGDSMEIGIAVQSVAATNVRILQTALVEQTRKLPLDGLMLCRQDSCDPPINLAPNSANRLWLRVKRGSTPIGKYAGSITIGAEQKPEGETLSDLTIYGTTLCYQIAGALFVIIGVLGGWVVTVWVPGRVSRLQALQLAALALDHVRALQELLDSAPTEASKTDRKETADALRKLSKALGVENLDYKNYLPGAMPLPFKGFGPDLDGYKKFLTDVGAKIAVLDLVIKDGFIAVWKDFTPPPNKTLNPQALAALAEASQALDKISAQDPPKSESDVGAQIKTILAKLASDLATAYGPGRALLEVSPAVQSRSFAQLQVAIADLSGVTWLVFGVIASVVGIYVLVINNLGFGLPSDYFYCLLWGFALPTSSQQLAQSTVASVQTALSIQLPKTAQ